ncbi:MAG: hypothetical protein GEV08_20740, partial [Acidimicrobiia bacterium]|nr:hypothetical protein [Acidimicrobiia bacterium]
WAPVDPGAAPSLAPTSLRLVVQRRMYDAATRTAKSPSLAGLHPEATVRLNPADLAQVGVAEQATVRLTSPRTGAEVDLVALADDTVPRGCALAVANLPGAELNGLLSADSPITDIRVDRI